MFITFDVCHTEFDLVELEEGLALEKVTESLNPVFRWLRSLCVHILKYFSSIDVVGADLNQLFFHAFHVL